MRGEQNWKAKRKQLKKMFIFKHRRGSSNSSYLITPPTLCHLFAGSFLTISLLKPFVYFVKPFKCRIFFWPTLLIIFTFHWTLKPHTTSLISMSFNSSYYISNFLIVVCIRDTYLCAPSVRKCLKLECVSKKSASWFYSKCLDRLSFLGFLINCL